MAEQDLSLAKSRHPMRLCIATSCTLLLVLSTSCGSGVKVAGSQFEPMLPGMELKVPAQAFRTTGRKGRMTLPELFRWTDGAVQEVTLNTDSLGGVTVRMGTSAQRYEGKRSPHGYYEIDLERNITEIPPLLPIIYSERHLSRLRLAMTKQGELVIDHKWANDGNIFLLAGGGSGRTQYFFRPVKTTP
ncbi:MAG TPA: hypothetical protein VGE21_10290 [Flavobacteriales bacterium]